MALKKKKTSKKNSSSGRTTHREVLEEIIRVDHAGEYGATKIYDGQIAIFGKSSKLGKTIQHMADQEQEHIDKFNELIRNIELDQLLSFLCGMLRVMRLARPQH